MQLRCCASGVLDHSGSCCQADSVLDGAGACCPAGSVDACGVCKGDARVVDVQGVCCSSLVDAAGLCCQVGWLQLPRAWCCAWRRLLIWKRVLQQLGGHCRAMLPGEWCTAGCQGLQGLHVGQHQWEAKPDHGPGTSMGPF